MSSLALFTDVSLSPQRRLGMGASLLVPAALLEGTPDSIIKSEINKLIALRRFTDTSAARLEVQAVLWALNEYRDKSKPYGSEKLSLHTDSQCVAGLPGRRAKLEACEFLSRRTGRPLKNTSLYRKFYEHHDALKFDVIKVKGHAPASDHDTAQRLFSLIDKKARNALKHWIAAL